MMDFHTNILETLKTISNAKNNYKSCVKSKRKNTFVRKYAVIKAKFRNLIQNHSFWKKKPFAMYSLLCVLDEVDGDKKKLQNLLKLSLQI